ncbi:MAG TPA: DUF401 family protein [Atribacterota bacterium]|nr:DUF401 family protein [Atribacterota bacterium]
MIESIKLISVIMLIIIMLRLRWDLGLTMFLSSILLNFLFHISFKGLLYNIYFTVTDPTTLQLIGIVVLVYILSGILKRTKSMEGIVYSLQQIVSDYRIILFLIASFLGLIPMVSGAMFSAPLLKEIGEENQMSPEEIMLSNYWFRHVWELFLPLIPGVVLYISIIGVSVRDIVIAQFPLTIFALSIGFFWMYLTLRKINKIKITHANLNQNLFTFLKHGWSILLVLLLVISIKMNLLGSLIITIILLLIIKRVPFTTIKEIIIHDISIKILFMIIGIMLFKQVLNNTNSLEPISHFLSEKGVNIWIILFFIPFILGLLTGITAGFVGISFPIILPLMLNNGSLNLSMAMFAYLAGFAGMMVSPMHLCLALTVEYLKVDITKFYKKLSLNLLALIIMSFAYIIFFNITISLS